MKKITKREKESEAYMKEMKELISQKFEPSEEQAHEHGILIGENHLLKEILGKLLKIELNRQPFQL